MIMVILLLIFFVPTDIWRADKTNRTAENK